MFILIYLVYIGYLVVLANHIEGVRDRVHASEPSLIARLYPALAAPEKADHLPEPGVRPTFYNTPGEAKGVRRMLSFLYGLLLALLTLYVLGSDLPRTPSNALDIYGRAIAFASIVGVALVLYSHWVRSWLTKLFPRFDPSSYVHRTALLLIVADVTMVLSQYLDARAGGLSRSWVLLQEPLLFNLTMLSTLALLGVGLLTRRGPRALCARLKLRWPRLSDLVWGILGAFGSFVAVIIALILIVVIANFNDPSDIPDTPSSEYEETVEATEERSREAIIVLLTIGFIRAACAGIGEELLYRGALQPIFGLVPTAIYFMLAHGQYFGNIGMVSVLCGGLILGVLRNRQSTVAAIIAHTGYNFILVVLRVL